MLLKKEQGMLIIENSDSAGQSVGRDWRATGPDAARKDDDGKFKNSILDETHHSAYGRPWCLGRDYFDALVDVIGVGRKASVLDFGCGTGRLGVWLINYLKEGRYVGIDSHLPSLRTFLDYEIPLHGLESKKPRLICDGDCSVDLIGGRFDYIFDMFVTMHLDSDQAFEIYRNFRTLLKPNGAVVIPHSPRMENEKFFAAGFDIVSYGKVDCPLLSKFGYPKNENDWHILRKIK